MVLSVIPYLKKKINTSLKFLLTFFPKCKLYYTETLFGRTFDRIIFFLFFVNISMVFSQVYFSWRWKQKKYE